jgi:hypothetical protein
MSTTRRFYVNSAPQQTLATGIGTSDTSFTIQTSFAGWPTSFPFFATLDAGTASQEHVLVTAIVGLVATATRAQDGSSAVTHAAGATVDQMFIRQDADEANAHTSASAGVHGISGSVTGTTDVQTLTNKSLTAPTITGTVAGGATYTSPALTTPTLTTPNITSGDLQVAGVEALHPVTGTTRHDGIIAPTSYTTESAANASSPGVGQLVYLSAPTGAGYSAGFYMSQGSGVFVPTDAVRIGSASQVLTFKPGSTQTSPASGTATWFTFGSITVPAWATKANVVWQWFGVFLTAASASNTTLQFKIGSAAGVSQRIFGDSATTNRFNGGWSEQITGLSAGSQSVVASATFVSGSTYNLDAQDLATATFTFLP